jgi:hypothetical protein
MLARRIEIVFPGVTLTPPEALTQDPPPSLTCTTEEAAIISLHKKRETYSDKSQLGHKMAPTKGTWDSKKLHDLEKLHRSLHK